MQQKMWLSIALGTIAILGLPSCAIDTSPNTVETQTQQEITIMGAATPYPALQLLADAYQEKQTGITITFLPSSQSPAGIAGVKESMADIGTVTRAPKPKEEFPELQYRQFVRDILIVGVHPSVTEVTNLQTEQLQAIYSGKITNWQEVGGPDAEIVLLDRAEDESAKRLLRKHYLGKDLANSPEATILRHESELVDILQNTPYSIGAFSLARGIANDLPINHLSLNGVKPTSESVGVGEYQMTRTLGIVYRNNPSDPVADFLDFLLSSEGTEILNQAGFVTVAPTQ